MINEVLFKHVTPSLDDVEQRLLEGLGIHAEPRVENLGALDFVNLRVQFFVSVDLDD